MRRYPAEYSLHGFCLVFCYTPFCNKISNKSIIRRPVPLHLHVVISDNSTQNIWTELCTKYYTRIKTGLNVSDKDRIKSLFFFSKMVQITKKRSTAQHIFSRSPELLMDVLGILFTWCRFCIHIWNRVSCFLVWLLSTKREIAGQLSARWLEKLWTWRYTPFTISPNSTTTLK
jgi:hypothetical protein